jgi:hypothetical protein
MHLETSSLHRQGLITDRSSAANDVKVPQHKEDSRNMSRSQKRPNKVSFNKGVRVYHHIHLNDISGDEVMKTWYREEEIAKIVAECSLTINLLGDASSASPQAAEDQWPSLCFRGLEFRTQDGAASRRQNKYLGWDIVLDLQESQAITGEYDEESIARAYSDATRHCQDAAHLFGIADAQAVRHQDEEEYNEENSSLRWNLHQLDMELSSHLSKTQASLQPPQRNKLLRVVVSLGQLSSRSGKQHGAAA